ncbi:hypothetical protein [Citrifermentans bremense]|uniref:hypothetical protein n=1 Tax=Citrifermentans bremense TaxID=60035 RepID=UPI0012EC7225|nr:hypothetical protein [Citrifermentans bremense]
MKVSVGQEVQLLPGAQMANFSSKTLNRTFEKITFSAGAIAPTAPAAPAAEEDIPMSAWNMMATRPGWQSLA